VDVLSVLKELVRRLPNCTSKAHGDAKSWRVGLTVAAAEVTGALFMAHDVVEFHRDSDGLPRWPVIREDAWPADVMSSYLRSILPPPGSTST
jgi:hypothetical protein